MRKLASVLKANWPLLVGWAAIILVAGVLRCSCGPSNQTSPLQFSTIATQGPPAQTSFAGTVDPTVVGGPAGASVMTACAGSCSSALAEQNRAALKATLDFASTNKMVVYIPPGEYPVGCAAGQTHGVALTGSNASVLARGATLRFTGDLASGPCSMLKITGSNVKLEGATISLRDATNATSDTVGIQVGDGGTTAVDNVALVDVQFIEGASGSGDFVRLDGGSSTTTPKVTQVTFERDRFEGSARGGINIRPGVQELTIAHNIFRSNANRDIWFESSTDGSFGRWTIVGNFIETDKANAAVTLSGFVGANTSEQNSFTFNRVMPLVTAATGGGVVEAYSLGKTVFAYNTVITWRSTSAPSLLFSGDIQDVQIVDNYLDRRAAASSAAVLKVSDDGSSAPSGNVIRGNRVKQYSGIAPGIDVSSCERCAVTENKVTYHASTADSGTTGFAGIYCAGTALKPCSGTWTRNVIRRDDQDIRAAIDLATKTANDNTVVEFFRSGTEGNSATISFVGDSGTTAGSLTGTQWAKVVHYRPGFTTVSAVETLFNSTSFKVRTAGTGSNVLQAGDAFAASNFTGGVQAGRMLAGLEILKGTGTTVGSIILRDNFVDGAAFGIYLDAEGAAQYPESYPLVSGNGGVNVATDIGGGVTTWRAESTPLAETVASGACSVTKDVTYITTTGTQSYTLANGIKDGQRHCFKVKTAASTPSGTWTPTNFADGTTHTITWTSATDVAWCVVWDNTSTTWRLVSKSSGATLN